MKFGKIDIKKNKKASLIEITVVSIVLIAFGIYYSPNFMHQQIVMKAAKIKADNSVFTSRALEEFAQNTSAKPTDVAKKVSEELNLTAKNPYDKKAPAYTFEANCKGCNSIECDDELSMIILTTYDKTGDLVARTVIKPPSFVVYAKDEEPKNKSWFDNLLKK